MSLSSKFRKAVLRTLLTTTCLTGATSVPAAAPTAPRAVGEKMGVVPASTFSRLSESDLLRPRRLPFASLVTGTSAVVENTKRVVFERADGSREIRLGGTMAWRHYNPGNLAYGPNAIKFGAVARNGRWAVFPDYATGHIASRRLLREDARYIDIDIDSAVVLRSPPFENNTPRMQRIIRETMNTRSMTRAGLSEPLQRRILRAGILSGHERIRDLPSQRLNDLLRAVQEVNGFAKGKNAAASFQKLLRHKAYNTLTIEQAVARGRAPFDKVSSRGGTLIEHMNRLALTRAQISPALQNRLLLGGEFITGREILRSLDDQQMEDMLRGIELTEGYEAGQLIKEPPLPLQLQAFQQFAGGSSVVQKTVPAYMVRSKAKTSFAPAAAQKAAAGRVAPARVATKQSSTKQLTKQPTRKPAMTRRPGAPPRQ